jgi:hypothetical protein
MAEQRMTARGNWKTLRMRLAKLDTASLVAVVRDLYEASPDNRRFLHARLLGGRGELDKYRRLVEDAVFPDPLSRKPVRIAEAKRLIRHYGNATGDQVGVADLLLSAVAAGTEQAADLGYGNDSYFTSLLGMLGTAVGTIQRLPAKERPAFAKRLDSIAHRAAPVGWGYGDAVREMVAWPKEQ